MVNTRKYTISCISMMLIMILLLTGCSYEELWRDYGSTSTASEDSSSQNQSIWEQGSRLRGDDLSFDDFLEELFLDSVASSTMSLHFYLADPESYGITPGPVSIGGFGYEDKESSREAIDECRRILEQYRNAGLTREQQITADVLFAYLNNSEKDLELDYYYEPLKSGMGAHASIPYSLAEYAFYDKQDVEDYLILLTQLGEYFQEILDWEEEKAEEGLFMTDELLDRVIEECSTYQWDGKESFFVHDTFVERLEQLPELTTEEKDTYLKREEEILRNEFYQAYELLKNGMEKFRGTGTNEMGVCYYPKGTEYFEYLIESNIGMTYNSVDDLYQELFQEIIFIYGSVDEILSKDETLWDQWMVEIEDSRSVDEMLKDLQKKIQADFPEIPNNSYQVKKVSKSMEDFMNPAFFMIPPIDRYDENVIYINEKLLETNYNLYTVLAHEGYPGHLYQNVYFNDSNLPNFRKMLDFTGYSEGWGTYAEYYSYQWLDNMSNGLQQLNCLSEQLNMCISALMDLGINYYGWSREDAAILLNDLGIYEAEETINEIYPIIINDPAGYLDYYVGYLEIRNMAEEAQGILGDQYSAQQFHGFLLDFGPAPFSVIRPYFDEWLQDSQNGLDSSQESEEESSQQQPDNSEEKDFKERFPDIDYNPIIASAF